MENVKEYIGEVLGFENYSSLLPHMTEKRIRTFSHLADHYSYQLKNAFHQKSISEFILFLDGIGTQPSMLYMK